MAKWDKTDATKAVMDIMDAVDFQMEEDKTIRENIYSNTKNEVDDTLGSGDDDKIARDPIPFMYPETETQNILLTK